MIQAIMLLTSSITAYAILVAMLLRNLPHMLQSAEQVAAPQHDAATDHSVAALGTSSSGRESKAPMLSSASRVYCSLR